MPAAALAVAVAVAAPVAALAMLAAALAVAAAAAAPVAALAMPAAALAVAVADAAWHHHHHHHPNLRSGLGTCVSTPERYSGAQREYRQRNGMAMAPASEIAGILGESSKVWGQETHRLQHRNRENY